MPQRIYDAQIVAEVLPLLRTALARSPLDRMTAKGSQTAAL